jgi:predicted unusual protein kinase regulating ubiquinone biosynthesis (AarF/ABC1/UbiB family)
MHACSFGDVYQGTWMGSPVAIKTLKRDVDEIAKADFFQEADIMK